MLPEEIDNADPRCKDDTYWAELMSRMKDVTRYLRLCKTEAGRLGQIPYGTEVGDVVAIFLGSDVPFVLRKHEDTYRLVGACYINGAMDGHLCRDPKHQYSKDDEFPIVTLV